jgi:NTE family protein
MSKTANPPEPTPPSPSPRRVLVLQGGGALGSYQAGVYQALHNAGMVPTWVAGVSIGAINGAIIAGNPPELRMERLRAFWEGATSALVPAPVFQTGDGRTLFNEASAAWIAAFGAPGFFAPRVPPPWLSRPGTPEAISFYDTSPLRRTLEQLIDFDRLNSGEVRLSIGAVDIEHGNLIVFDTAKERLTVEHVMASGALPPGFPPVYIDGRAYWDGGIVSNTPLRFVMDESGDEDLLIFQVDLFPSRGPMPRNLAEASEREKDIRYSSRTRLNTDASLRMHEIKGALRDLLDSLPAERAADPSVKLLWDAAQESAVTVVQLIYRKRPYEGGSKDYEFSRQTMLEHWASGLADVEHAMHRNQAALEQPKKAGVTVLDPGLRD